MKSVKEIRKLSDGELQKELKSAQESLLKLRFQKVVDEVTDTTQLKKNRRAVAQMKTILRERELTQNAAQNT